jgi:hypothetical protein
MLRTCLCISVALCLALTLAASRAHAQQAPTPSVSLPLLGFVVDQGGALRPLVGVAGSASVSAPINVGFGISQAVMPPNRDYLLATTPGADWPMLLQMRGGTITILSKDAFFNNVSDQTDGCFPSSVEDDGPRTRCPRGITAANEISNVNRIALSSTGASAAFLSESHGRIYAFSNLAQMPTSSGTFDVRGLGAVSAFGISDDARTVAFAVFDGSAGSLYVASSGQAPQFIASIHHAAAIQFLRNSDTAVVADDMDNKVYTLAGGQIYAIAGPDDGIANPVGMGVSNDNQRVFVGNSAAGSVTTISFNGTATQSTSCDCTLTGLRPTNSDSVFQITDFSGGPIVLFDGNSATPRTIFVPVAAKF